MKNWIKNIFQRTKKDVASTWQTNDSILRFLYQHIDIDGRLKDTAHTLPDEEKDAKELKFAPGLMDAMLGENTSKESNTKVAKLADLLNDIAQYGSAQSQLNFYKAITGEEALIGIIDAFLQKIVELSLPIEPYLYDFAYALATKTNNKHSVKFGIAILGLCQKKEAIKAIKTLGLHDEFTLFASVALINLSDEVAEDLWTLAQRVDGWGKIQIVDRLVEMELSTAIEDWLVYEGYKNSIMYEYLALACAVKGRLNDRLLQENIDDQLFTSAGEIIVALMDEGPAAGMSAYENAYETIYNYIKHAEKRNLNISDFVVLSAIKDYLAQTENSVLVSLSQSDILNCIVDIEEKLNAKDWRLEVENGLKSTDHIEFWNAKQVAKKLNMDIWDFLWDRLLTDPFNSVSWYDVTEQATREQGIDIIIQAVLLLPLKELATGPKDALGIGPDYQKYQALDYVIAFLENYPALGEEIILAGLNSPVTRNRNIAIKTLEKWRVENWSRAIKEALMQLHKIEPNFQTKENLEKLLQDNFVK